MIEVNKLQKRLEQIEEERRQVLANLNALIGAKKILEELISEEINANKAVE